MRIVIISNYLTHHLSYFCESLLEMGVGLLFVACEKTPQYRLDTGFSEMNHKPYVARLFDEKTDKKKVLEEISSADAVIIGSGDNSLIRERIDRGLLVFRFSEHLSKSHYFFLNALRILKWGFLLQKEVRCSSCYLLCSSYWASKDYSRIGWNKSRMLKWGYFPGFDVPTKNELVVERRLSFVWAGRVLNWKHPEFLKIAFDFCSSRGIEAEYNLYGRGVYLKSISKAFAKTPIKINEPVKRENMCRILKKGTVFLFSSDQGEGWGAILNEAMHFGCICICNAKAGSSRLLIRDGQNGFLYETKEGFNQCLERVVSLSTEERARISQAATRTIDELWNPAIAASNFIRQVQHIKDSNTLLDTLNGPASKFD